LVLTTLKTGMPKEENTSVTVIMFFMRSIDPARLT
jgi:hypothetical protein